MAITHFPETGTSMMVQSYGAAGRSIMHTITEVIASAPEGMTVRFTDVDGSDKVLELSRDGTPVKDGGRTYNLC